MKNADMSAMPHSYTFEVTETNDFTRKPYNKTVTVTESGLTKREMFAMHAPHVEPGFSQEYAAANKSNHDLVVIFKSENMYQLTTLGHMMLIKEWRYAYADMMLSEEKQ